MHNKKVGREVALYMINENDSKNKILQLAKSYSKEHHLKFLPYDGDNIFHRVLTIYMMKIGKMKMHTRMRF